MTSLTDDEIQTVPSDGRRLEPQADADGDDTDTTDGDADDSDADDTDADDTDSA
jgi:ribonuclease E